MIHIVLCGGSGTRLWPLSRKHLPKQFCSLVGNSSLYQKTVERNIDLVSSRIIVTGADHYFLAMNQLSSMTPSVVSSTNYLLEPCPRNTAPAIALACMSIPRDEIVLVTPSDHLIGDDSVYKEAVTTAAAIARQGHLVTFGMVPLYPETGYGYIESAEPLEGFTSAYTVRAFREKPDRATAEQYIAKGSYFWNSGMFAFTAGAFLDELEKSAPEVFKASVIAFEQRETHSDNSGSVTLKILKDLMSKIPSDSIDYAVMEKSSKVAVVRASFTWNDLGSFDSLYDVLDRDKSGNTATGDLISIDSSNNLVVSGGRKIATVGIENAIIIDTPDALLVGVRGQSQLVKKVVESLENGSEHDRTLAEFHQTVYRPWGSYTVLEEGVGYKIKRIVVEPGKRLSLQKHIHRSEHWVVVRGTAEVTVGTEKKIVRMNESTYIPIGEVHRLENTGKIGLSIIETQVGDYLGEDDIIRIEDDFSRA